MTLQSNKLEWSPLASPDNITYFFSIEAVAFLQIKTKIVSSHTADTKSVKQEVNSTIILPP